MVQVRSGTADLFQASEIVAILGTLPIDVNYSTPTIYLVYLTLSRIVDPYSIHSSKSDYINSPRILSTSSSRLFVYESEGVSGR